MRLSLVLACVALALPACAPRVRVTTRETPLEAGVPAPFLSERATRWDFGDGTATAQGAQVTHAFRAAGRYEVQGFDGEDVVERVSVLVEPRAVFHTIPPDADLAVALRTADELSPAVDFLERLMGGEVTQKLLERWPAFGFAVDQAPAGDSVLDAREGLAAFTWPGRELEVSAVGVKDDEAALKAFAAWLGERGWGDAGVAGGLHRFERDGRDLDVFVDRGTLYAVAAPPRHREPSAQARLAAMDGRGLEADGPTAAALDGLAAGGLVVLARSTPGTSWSLLTLAVKVLGDRAWVAGRAHAKGPLWTAPKVQAKRLLTQAPAGPIAVASATLSPGALLSLGGLGRGTPRYRELAGAMAAEGVDLEAALAGFEGAFDAAAYFDVPGFVRSTLANDGRPEPEVSLLVEAPVKANDALKRLVEVHARNGLDGAKRQEEGGVTLWRGAWRGRPVDVALSKEALFVKAGAPVDDREPVDLSTELGQRYEGAFAPGHVSLFFDVGQLRRELMMPRLMDDVDPRRALPAQALAVTFLDRLTRLDSVMLDAAPDEQGAVLHAVVTLRAADAK
ncbi:MAG: PKD domain-containing protein [Myxococcota bacterium]